MRQRQSGFTLVEIAIVLVIIGLLLGGIIQGQQLINSARVKNLAETNSSVQAAYFGFIDRYRQVPGDMNQTAAQDAIGVTITGGGDANGILSVSSGLPYREPNAAWEHLSKSGFIQGSYSGGGGEPTAANNNAPFNAFNNSMILGVSPDYLSTRTTIPPRLQFIIGRGIPVGVIRELDTKVDDGNPAAGVFRATLATPTLFLGTNSWGGSAANCTTTATGSTTVIYNVAGGASDCNGLFLF
ncbi:MAG: prepilin-type N-terminal cleavage/methylation domain-containing protein [Gammaproteobacteria bacterium]|nr:prepilin-type N-terminal cleavage/methylation domain-containing protein [Gammaproteobacteria bacterium]